MTTVFPQLDKEDVYQYLLETHRVLRTGGMVIARDGDGRETDLTGNYLGVTVEP